MKKHVLPPIHGGEIRALRPRLKRRLQLLVDDGSSDSTLSLIKSYAKEDWVSYISFSRNCKEAAACALACPCSG